ncbi:MAG: gliding motility-associated C-terminal domain-containing protein [Flavobacteriales bacterium]
MRKFDDIIKNKLEGYEAPFDASAWSKLERSLDTVTGTNASGSNSFNLHLAAGVAATIVLTTIFTSLPNIEQKPPVVEDSDHSVPTEIIESTASSNTDAIEFIAQEVHLIDLGSAETVVEKSASNIAGTSENRTEEKQSGSSSDEAENMSSQTPKRIAENAQADFTAKGIQCAEHKVRFNANLDQSAKVTWMFDGLFVKDGLSAEHAFESAGTHEVRMIAEFTDNSKVVLKRDITIYEQPIADFDVAMNNSSECVLTDVILKATPSSNHYKWLMDGDSIGKGQTLQVRLKNGLHTVELVTINEAGCSAKDTYPIRVENGSEIFAPNAFSDNGDGLNDAWEVTGLENLRSFSLKITRVQSNSVVFETSTDAKWDGSINGTSERPVRGEQFTWVLSGTDECGNRIQQGGPISYSPTSR